MVHLGMGGTPFYNIPFVGAARPFARVTVNGLYRVILISRRCNPRSTSFARKQFLVLQAGSVTTLYVDVRFRIHPRVSIISIMFVISITLS